MIQQEVFKRYFGALLERHGKDWSELLIGFYYQELSKLLTDQEFILAVSESLRIDRFMPSVKDLVNCVQLSQEDNITLEWQQILERVRRKTSLQLSLAGERALEAIGGVTAVANSEPEQLSFIKHEFTIVYRVEEKRQFLASHANELLPSKSQELAASDWDSHPLREDWTNQILSCGVPEFTRGDQDRISFYEYARNQGWV